MNRRFIALSWLTLAASAVLCAPRADAANDAMMELLKVLKEQGTITPEAYEQLKGAAQADDESNTADAAQVKQAAQTLPKIETKGKLEIGTPDGEFSWRIGGRLHTDYATFNNDESNSGRSTTFASGSEIRRARMDITANVWRTWQFKFQYDFTGSGAAGIRDAYIRYLFKGAQPGWLTVGNFKEPFSLEEYTSSNNVTFMERALPNVFAPSRRIGLGGSTWGNDLWTASAGLFGEMVAPENDQPGCSNSINNRTTNTICTGDDSEGYAGVARVTVSPIHTANRVLHLGAAGEWRAPDDGDAVRFRQRPEANLADRLIDTGNIPNVDLTSRYGAELAGVYGPFSLQGEYIYVDVDREVDKEPDYDGWYIFASYLLTGESRIYKFEDGVFENPKPFGIVGKGGWGAWELALRYSSLDLTDKDIVSSTAGDEQNFTAGLNWYPTPNFKFMANYVKVLDLDGGSFDGAEPSAVMVRAQAYW